MCACINKCCNFNKKTNDLCYYYVIFVTLISSNFCIPIGLYSFHSLICLCIGLIDAASKIYKSEGVGGLYRGFWVSSVQIVSGVLYIATYEGVRHVLTQHNASPSVKSLVGGGAASLVGQTIIVPFDILSQHLMVLGFRKVSLDKGKNKVSLNY